MARKGLKKKDKRKQKKGAVVKLVPNKPPAWITKGKKTYHIQNLGKRRQMFIPPDKDQKPIVYKVDKSFQYKSH